METKCNIYFFPPNSRKVQIILLSILSELCRLRNWEAELNRNLWIYFIQIFYKFKFWMRETNLRPRLELIKENVFMHTHNFPRTRLFSHTSRIIPTASWEINLPSFSISLSDTIANYCGYPIRSLNSKTRLKLGIIQFCYNLLKKKFNYFFTILKW